MFNGEFFSNYGYTCSMQSTGHSLYLYATGFWKTGQIVMLGLFYFITSTNNHTYALSVHSAITKLIANCSASVQQILPTM